MPLMWHAKDEFCDLALLQPPDLLPMLSSTQRLRTSVPAHFCISSSSTQSWLSLCDFDREQEQETVEAEQAELRMVATQVMWQSCGEPYLLQPFIPDMRGNEYRWAHVRLACLQQHVVSHTTRRKPLLATTAWLQGAFYTTGLLA